MHHTQRAVLTLTTYVCARACARATCHVPRAACHRRTRGSVSTAHGWLASLPRRRRAALTALPRRRAHRYFPIFMKYITGGFVGETEAGMRLFQVTRRLEQMPPQ